MPTIYDIAKQTGYSPSTVSKALNNYPYVSQNAKYAIMTCAQEIGFIPNFFAKSLMLKRSYLIGVLIYEELGIGLLHPFFGGIIEGFRKIIEKKGYELLIIKKEHMDNTEDFVEHCRQRGIEGVFIVVSNIRNKNIENLVLNEIPCVSVDIYDEKVASVLSDNEHGGYLATKYLIECGHTKIAHIAGNFDKLAGLHRYNGYKRALREAKLDDSDDLVAHTVRYTGLAGETAMRELMNRKQEFSAVFAASDTLAYGAAAVCKSDGMLIPQDMSLIGFDDIESAEFFNPPLTTVRQPKKDIGIKAGEILVNCIESQDKSDIPHIFLSTELVIRQSCCKKG